jgi:hypothetical protein
MSGAPLISIGPGGLPPPKDAPPTAENVRALRDWLAGLIAFRSQTSAEPWIFYEQVDSYLGPWGPSGYPIAYGKKYCRLFFEDERLNANLAGRAWVRRTLVLLQSALEKFMIERFSAGRLGSVTSEQFKQVAFASHPVAYTEGGLGMVTVLSPTLMLHLLTIPAVEFLPWSPTFMPTMEQALITADLIVPGCILTILTSLALPAHTGSLARAATMDWDEFERRRSLGRHLAEAAELVRAGRIDHVGLLDDLLRAANRTEYLDDDLASEARRLVDAIQLRRSYIVTRYHRETRADPSLLPVFERFDPRAPL